ncbi:MAG: type I DNA topoisomerase [bacterium]|nr:type I DNA topoisomerase [bacterium]MDY2830526.1 type I DNA topoisomerase [Alphaproteobacteria bacterium]
MKLVIVESPAKAKTINKYLGKDYQVLASFGHIRDLPSKDGSVNPDDDFAMTWELSPGGKKRLADIVKALKDADTLILASDPDREGEAIAWHILEELKAKKALKGKTIERVVFHEITKSAVTEAIKNPRTIDDNLVSAYMARRALDYLVGFTLSPVLWRKLPGSRSAGRVQSVALRLICDRETEIEKFKAEEYWTIDADLLTASQAVIKSHLIELDRKKLEKFDLNTEAKAMEAKAKIEAQDFAIENVERKKANRYPAPPFTTSTLQQEAARKLRFSAKKTMQIAQKLYEEGLITYMRTDAVNLSKEAISACRDAIVKYFGEAYLPKQPKEYKTKSKNAQEAHEAIRPSDVMNTPKKMEVKLAADEHKLYELIWKRTVACQMMPALLDKVVIDARSADTKILLRANGQVIEFDGFLKLYQESKDDSDDDDENRILPNVAAGEKVDKGEITAEQHFTTPPPRFTEASLVKKLEELGIGRPSTYATIIAVLQERKYVRVEKLRFIPEDRGRIVTVFLENFFKKYVEYDFTAQMEEFLDDVSAGEMQWKKLLEGFWAKFIKNVDAVKPLQMSEVIDKIDEALSHHLFPPRADGSDPRICPECGTGRLSIKLGKFGAFIGCSNYPECKYTKPLVDTASEEEQSAAPKIKEVADVVLGEINGQKIYLKKGPYGFYVQLGEDQTATTEKPKRASLPKGINSDEITFEQAERLLSLPYQLGEGIEVNSGKFGPYIKCGGKSVSLRGNDTIFNITIERAKELLAGAKEKPAGKALGIYPKNKQEIVLLMGRYGPYLKCGRTNYAIPKNISGHEPTLDEAIKIIEAKK